MAFEHISSELTQRKQQGLLRTTTVVESLTGASIKVSDKSYINFSANDYLGMSHHPKIAEAARLSMSGSGASPVVTGHSVQHQALCEYLQELTGQEAVMLFTSGFAANHAICQTLLNSKEGLLLADKLSHASIIDGALASNANFKRFAHNDMDHLQSFFSSAQHATENKDVLVISEGVFSMDGDAAPLSELLEICAQNNAWLMMDYAHAIGCQPAQKIFRTTTESNGKNKNRKPQIAMATFGKAVGTGGAFVAASQEVISYLQNFARHYVYSTAFSPSHASATLTSLQLIEQETWRRDKLMENIAYFKRGSESRGIPVMDSVSAIQPVVIGDPKSAVEISQGLKSEGFWVSAIRYPTVPKNTDRLRITLTADHDLQQIADLLDALQKQIQSLFRKSA